MSKIQKQQFILKHFSKQCRIPLVDIMKGRKSRKRRSKQCRIIQKEEACVGRKKYSCYICFDKFCTKEELEHHKLAHVDDDDEERSRESTATEVTESAQGEEEDSQDEVSSNEMGIKTSNRKQYLYSPSKGDVEMLVPKNLEAMIEENSEKDPNERESFTSETNYKCLSCNVYFQNQVDIKTHIHNQYSCKYYCKRCGRQFNTKGGFIVHVLQHGMKQTMSFSYKCDKCPFSFDDCYQLKRHYVTVHNIFTDSATKLVENIPKNIDIVNTTQDIVSNNVAKDKPSISTTHSVDPQHLPNRDSSNPITGAIPIFDCCVCYDVFASAKALRRHKALHQELDGKNDVDNPTICIEDDDMQVVQQDAWPTPHEAVSNFTTTKKTSPDIQPRFITESLAKLTPLRLEPSMTNLTESMPDLNADLIESSKTSLGRKLVDKTELTAQITQMLGEKTRKYHSPRVISGNNLQRQSSAKKTVVLKRASAPQTITKYAVPKPVKVPVSTGTSGVRANDQNMQFINAINSGIRQQSVNLMSGGQSFFVLNQNDLTVASSNPQETKGSSSSSSQRVITQPVNTLGVATNSSTSGTSGRSVLINSNINAVNQASILNSLGGLSGLDPGQTIYVLLPTGEPNKNEGLSAVQSLSAVKKKNEQNRPLRQIVKENFKSIISTSGANLTADRCESLNQDACLRLSAREDSDLGYENFKNTDYSMASDSVVMPVITNVETTEDILDSPGESREHSEFVMPIITSISTVSEDYVNKNEKIRKDPVSMYESEFAKFLREKNDGGQFSNLRSLKSKPSASNFAISSLCTTVLDKTSDSEKLPDVKIETIDEDKTDDHFISESMGQLANDLPQNEDKHSSNVVLPQSSGKSASVSLPDNIMPKIFVKKLTDLIDVSRISPEPSAVRSQQQTLNSEYCNFCKEPFHHWMNYKAHMQRVHGKFACKFFRCHILENTEEHREHMKSMHYCIRCAGEFRSLAAHDKYCSFPPVQNLDNSQESSNSQMDQGDPLS